MCILTSVPSSGPDYLCTMAERRNMLSVEGLTKTYGERRLFTDLTFELRRRTRGPCGPKRIRQPPSCAPFVAKNLPTTEGLSFQRGYGMGI